MSKWEKVKLGTIGDFKSGGTPSRNKSEYFKGNLPWITTTALGKTFIDESDAVEYITKEAVLNSSTKIILEDSIMVGIRVGVGKVSINTVPMCTNQDLIAIENIDEKRIFKPYIVHCIKSYSNYFNTQKRGATIQGINSGVLKSLEIPLPPLEIQRQIAKTLDTAAELLALRKQQLSELDNLIKSIFYDMFGDPVTNEKGWDVVKLSDFYEDSKTSVKCGPFGSALKKEEYVPNGVPVWVMDNITKQGDFIDKVYLCITEEKFNSLEGYSVKKGDIIISRAGTVGKMCVLTANYNKSIISTNLIRLRLNHELLPIYVVKLITIWGNRVCRLKTGDDGSFTHMNTGVLDTITFPYPPLSLQTQFASIVTKIEEQKALVKKAIDETQYLFDSLMSEYFE